MGEGDLRQLEWRHPRGRSAILIGSGALEAAGRDLGLPERRRLFVLTSPRVAGLYRQRVENLVGASAHWLEVPDGEEAKTLAQADRLWQQMLRLGGKRDSLLVTVGGGTVGDLGGFVAGAFLRGIEYIQVPTTLLAQVDASVGGKTGIDLPQAKNSVGLFHHPTHVLAETDFLASLPTRELRCGLFEVVKMAALLDPSLLEETEKRLDRLLTASGEDLTPIVAGAIAAKIAIVEADPEEGDQRRLLNFGHTLAHAIEAVLGYSGLRHGEAVGYGMLFALVLARRRGWAEELSGRLGALIRRLSLPPLPELSSEALCTAMSRDKKALEHGLQWVLPRRLGEGAVVPIDSEEVRDCLDGFLEDPWAGFA